MQSDKYGDRRLYAGGGVPTEAGMAAEKLKQAGYNTNEDRIGPPFPPIVSVAAVLEYKDKGEKFWYMSPTTKLDVIFHFSLWVFAYVMEVLVWLDVEDMRDNPPNGTLANPVPFLYATSSFSLLTISFTFLLLVWAIHICSGYALQNHLDSFIVTTIVSPVNLSLLFTLIIAIFATPFTTYADEWRMRTILCIIAKGFLSSQLQNNLRQIGSVADRGSGLM